MVESASVVAALVVVAGVVGMPVAALTGGPADAQVAANETANGSVAPGERLAGVVGVEKAAVQSEIETRAFGQRIAAARSNASRARVVGAQLDDLQSRLDELAAERAELRAAHENGSISNGQYRARLAQLHAEERALQRLANSTEAVATDIPDETLAANGVNVTAIRTLKAEAANLTGPEVAAIARSIAGNRAGQGLGPDSAGPPALVTNDTDGERGPPADAGPQRNGTDGPGQGNAQSSGTGGDAGQGDPGPQTNETGGDGGPPADNAPQGQNETAGEGDSDQSDAPGNETDGGAGQGDAPDNETDRDSEQSDAPDNETDGGPGEDGPPSDDGGSGDGDSSGAAADRSVGRDSVVLRP